VLAGLNALEVGRLRMSVGYGTHKKGRPLSPIEVGRLLRRAQEAGTSLEDCAKTLNLSGTTGLSRFLAVLTLPPDLRHLVTWGRSADSIGFTTAVELVRVPDADDQRAIANAILERGLRTDEVRQVAQIRKRSGRPVEDCLNEIVGMRPTIERRYVFIAAITDEDVQAVLGDLTQAERDALLDSVMESLGVSGVSARLGERLITLVGDDSLNSWLSREGKETVEARLRTLIAEKVSHVQPKG